MVTMTGVTMTGDPNMGTFGQQLTITSWNIIKIIIITIYVMKTNQALMPFSLHIGIPGLWIQVFDAWLWTLEFGLWTVKLYIQTGEGFWNYGDFNSFLNSSLMKIFSHCRCEGLSPANPFQTNVLFIQIYMKTRSFQKFSDDILRKSLDLKYVDIIFCFWESTNIEIFFWS